MYRLLGEVEGVGNIMVDDQDGIDLITQSYKKDGILAKTTLSADHFDRPIFSADVDYSTLKRKRSGEVEFGVYDGDSDNFIQNIDQEYSIPLLDSLPINPYTTGNDYTLGVDKDNLSWRWTDPSALRRDLSPVFKQETNNSTLRGTVLTNDTPESGLFYKNTTGSKLSLAMSIGISGKIRATTDGVYSAKVLVKDAGGAIVWDVLINQVVLVPNTDVIFSVSEDMALSIPIEASVFFVMEYNDATYDLTVDFDADSEIVLSEGTEETYEIPCVSVNDALSSLAELASSGSLTIKNQWNGGNDHYLTSYGAVRGKGTPLNLAFGTLFDDLSSLYNLRLRKVGSELILESFSLVAENAKPFVLDQVDDYEVGTNFNGLYRSVLIGFKNWKSGNDGGVADVTAPATLKTILTSAKKDLDLTCTTLVGSRRVLEQAYQLRGRPDATTSNDDKDYWKMIIKKDGAFNSYESIGYWKGELGLTHKELSRVAGEGAYSDVTGEIISLDMESYFKPDMISIECYLTTEDFSLVGDFVEFSDLGSTYVVYVESITHRPYKFTDSSNTTIEGVLLKKSLY
jgi:hypothetical protein